MYWHVSVSLDGAIYMMVTIQSWYPRTKVLCLWFGKRGLDLQSQTVKCFSIFGLSLWSVARAKGSCYIQTTHVVQYAVALLLLRDYKAIYWDPFLTIYCIAGPGTDSTACAAKLYLEQSLTVDAVAPKVVKRVSIFRNLEWVPTQNGQCQESNYHQRGQERDREQT